MWNRDVGSIESGIVDLRKHHWRPSSEKRGGESTLQTPNSRILWWWFSKSYTNQI